MLVIETHKDVPTKAGGDMSMLLHAQVCRPWVSREGCYTEANLYARRPGVFIFHPTIANYPKAKFPAVVVFSEIYQGTYSRLLARRQIFSSTSLTT